MHSKTVKSYSRAAASQKRDSSINNERTIKHVMSR